MTRICNNCGYENQDDYDYCAKCGTPLVEGLKPKQVFVYRPEDVQINKKALAISYIATIILSWSGFIVSLISKNTFIAVFTFFGFFMPFYLIQAPVKELRKHGFIQLAISIVGVSLSFYVMFH